MGGEGKHEMIFFYMNYTYILGDAVWGVYLKRERSDHGP